MSYPYSTGDVPVSGRIGVTSPLDTYATFIDQLGQGGWQTIDTIASRDLVPADRRSFGMIVSTQDGNGTFMLANIAQGGTDNVITNNANWIPYTGVGGAMTIGNLVGGGTPGSVLFIDNAGDLAENNPMFFWDQANEGLSIGGTTTDFTVNGITYASKLAVRAEGAQVAVLPAVKYADAGLGGVLFTARARGTQALPTDVQVGDLLGAYYTAGFAGTDFKIGAGFGSFVDSINSPFMGADMRFYTNDGTTAVVTERMRISAGGQLTVNTGVNPAVGLNLYAGNVAVEILGKHALYQAGTGGADNNVGGAANGGETTINGGIGGAADTVSAGVGGDTYIVGGQGGNGSATVVSGNGGNLHLSAGVPGGDLGGGTGVIGQIRFETNSWRINGGDYEVTGLLQPTAGQLTNDGLGNLTWTAGGGATLTSTQVAFGDVGNLMTSDVGFTYNLASGGDLNIGQIYKIASQNFAYTNATNVAVGFGTPIIPIMAGTDNTYLGDSAGAGQVSGNRNTLIGSGAGQAQSSGSDIIAIGWQANAGSDANNYLISIGSEAGESIASLTSDIISIGHWAGRNILAGSLDVIAIGQQAGEKNSGQDAIMIGRLAGGDPITGQTGTNVVLLGQRAGYVNSSNDLIAIGRQAGESNTGIQTVSIGLLAGQANSGQDAVIIGTQTGLANTGGFVTLVGGGAGSNNTGAYLTAIGDGAGAVNTGANVVAIGNATGNGNGGDNSVIIGNIAGQTNSGISTVLIGDNAGNANVGDYSTFIGLNAGATNTGLSNVIGIGQNAASANSGSHIIALGYLAAQNNTNSDSIFIGQAAGQNTTGAGTSIIAIGASAGITNSGTASILIGSGAGATNTGATVVAIGNSAGGGNTGSNVVCLGDLAGNTNTTSNKFIVGGNTGSGVELPNWQINGVSYVMPSALGSTGDVLTDTDGAGTLAWSTPTAVAGTTFVPTFTTVANLDATPVIVGTNIQYMRVGQTVTVSGRVTLDPTTTATVTSFRMSLPIASTLSGTEMLAGTAISSAVMEFAEIYADTTNNQAFVVWTATAVTSNDWSFHFTYRLT